MTPVLTGYLGDNSDLFKNAFPMFVEDGSDVLDMTFGLGVFWKQLDQSKYKLIRNDIDASRGDIHEDFRKMSLPSEYFDAVVLDPPYASRGGVRGIKPSIDRGYNNHAKAFQLGIVGNAKTMQFYRDGMTEACRLLKDGGLLFVKCMDEIMSGKQHRNHITILNFALEMGLTDVDMFILLQKTTPTMRHTYQLHARKNNSFLWVFGK